MLIKCKNINYGVVIVEVKGKTPSLWLVVKQYEDNVLLLSQNICWKAGSQLLKHLLIQRDHQESKYKYIIWNKLLERVYVKGCLSQSINKAEVQLLELRGEKKSENDEIKATVSQ